MSKRLTHVEIGGTSVDDYLLDWAYPESYGDSISETTITLPKNITGVVTLSNSPSLEMWEGFVTSTDKKIFSGYIETYAPDGYKIVVYGRDKLADTIRREVTHVYDKTIPGDPAYPNGKLSDIALDIIVNYCHLNADVSTVQDSGTIITISKFVCNHADPLERLKKLAETMGWALYYRADTDMVYFEPTGFTTNPTVLTVGDNIIELPKWKYSTEQMINDLTLEGAVMDQPREQLFSGNNSDTTFTLTTAEAPSHIDVYLSATKNYSTTSAVESEHKIGVPEGTTVGTFDYTFDLKQKKFTFSSTTPPVGTNNIYSKSFIETPNPIHRVDGVSITAYGRYKKTITLTDVMNVDDAEKRSDYIIAHYKNPFISGKLKMLVTDSSFKPGQQVRIVDNVSSPVVDDYFIITKITKKWPGNFDELEVGDKDWEPTEWQVNITERVKRLEETMIGDTAVVNEIVDQEQLFNMVPYSQEYLIEMLNDSFVVGIDPNDVVYDEDETAILDDFESAASWTGSGCTLSDDSTAGHFWVGTQGVRVTVT